MVSLLCTQIYQSLLRTQVNHDPISGIAPDITYAINDTRMTMGIKIQEPNECQREAQRNSWDGRPGKLNQTQEVREPGKLTF